MGQVIQKFSSLIGINNTIKQYVNTYENKDLLRHLLESELDKIELYLKEKNIEDARSQIDIILCKKESLPEELECRLIFLKGNIEIELGNYVGVNSIIDSLSKKEKGKQYSLELKYISAIKLCDEELFEECINQFISNRENDTTILKRKIKFHLNNKNFNRILENIDYIEENQILDRDIFYYIAVSYLNIGDSENAIAYCDRAREYGKSNLTTYVKILAEILPILQRKGILINILEEEKDLLREKEYILKELMNELPEEIIEEVITIILNIYMIIDLEEGIRFYDRNYEKLNNISGKFIIANIYELSYKYEKAKELYLEIIDKHWSEEVLIHIMFCMKATDDYCSYIKIFEKYENIIQDEEFLLTEYYLESLENMGYLQKAKEKLEESISKDMKSIRFKTYLAKLEEDTSKKIIILKEAEELLNEFNEIDRVLIKDVYLQIGMYDEAIRIIAPLFKYKEFLGRTIDVIRKNKKAEYYLELISEIDKHNDVRLLKYKRLMLEDINELLEAKLTAEEIYVLEDNRENLIDLIQLKIHIMDTTKLEDLILELIPLQNPEEYMLVAYGYFILGNIAKFNSYSYEAIFQLRGNFSEQIFRNYVSSTFGLIIQGRDKESKLDTVKEECVVVLKNEDEELNICFNSESKYQINEENFGCLHIVKDNPIWLEIISQSVGDKVYINDREFIIQEIIEKEIVVFRYCLKELQAHEIDFGLTTVNIDEIEGKMREIMIKDEAFFKNIFDTYNSQDNIGLPFSKIFFGEDIKKSVEMLQYILLSENNGYYIGLADYDLDKDVYVLSYQTLLLLENYNILDIVLKDSNKYYVSNIIKLKVRDAILDIKKNNIGLYLHYDSEIGLFREERDNITMLEKLNSIMDTINKLDTFKFNYKVRDKLTNLSRKFINEFDIETIYLAKEVKGTLIIDDLFIRKLIDSNEDTKEISHTNIVSILDILYKHNPTRYYDVIKKMVKDNVKYVLNKDNLKRLILEYKTYGYNINWFREVIDDMQNDDYYRGVILEVCREIIELRVHEYIIEELILVVKVLNLV